GDRGRGELLLFLLDVVLVAGEVLAVQLAEIARHQSPPLPRTRPARAPVGPAGGRARAPRPPPPGRGPRRAPVGSAGGRSRPAASPDHGGDATPRRVTR